MREAEVTIIAAAKKHGKSTLAEQMIRQHPFKNALIFKEGINLADKAFIKYPQITDLSKYKGGKKVVDGGYIDYYTFLRLVNKHFKDGLLLLDDIVEYEPNDLSPQLRPILVNNRKMGLEVILLYQAVGDVPKRMWRYVSNCIMGYTIENLEDAVYKLPNKGVEFFKARERIIRVHDRCKCGQENACKCGNRYYKEVIKLS